MFMFVFMSLQAVSMNDSYLNDEDYSGVQSEEDIKRILKDAQTPGPNKYNFDNAGHEVRCCWLECDAGVERRDFACCWVLSAGLQLSFKVWQVAVVLTHLAVAVSNVSPLLLLCPPVSPLHTPPHQTRQNKQQAGYEDDMIDNAIEDEYAENEQSFNPKQYQQRAGVAATTQ